MIANQFYYPVVLLFIVLTFESVDEILKFDHSQWYFSILLLIML